MTSASNNKPSIYTTGKNEPPPNWLPESRNVFAPTAVQLERVNKLKRFNLWAIYVPLGVLTTAVLGLLIYLLILAIWPPFEDTHLFISGIADIILILFMLPVVLILGLLLVGILGGGIYWRKSRKDNGDSSLQKKYGRLRLLLWKLDQKLGLFYQQADRLMPRLAGPVIRFNAFTAYINTWLAQLINQLYRHDVE
jgi:hypothetical protein